MDRQKAQTGYFIHESAIVEQGAEIAQGVKIWHFTHVMGDTTIGEGCNIGQNVFIDNKVRLGRNVKVQNNVSIYTGVIIEDDVFCGPSMVFTNVINPRSHVSRKHEYRRTLVRRGATLGANATIICGNNVGEFSFVGAGAVVTKDVPPYGLVYGNPARVRGWMCTCGVTLSFPEGREEELVALCTDCGLEYVRRGDVVRPKGGEAAG